MLVQAALQSQKQSVIAIAWRINSFLIDQHSINDTAHLDEMLPVPAIAHKAGYFTRRDGTYLAETNIGDHPVKAFPRDTADGRPAEVVIHGFNPAPAQIRNPIPHGILQGAAFPVVQGLVSR
ncbi:putative ATP-binding protein [Donghicola eburneus]|uniref:Putative ATP-binding protein n=1 Tax=Donghicola eburneus TaxID=393278 RepID=A0A1M4MY48_9RHOB|nr:putative ATP-binding protein [Donghicola eburneus]